MQEKKNWPIQRCCGAEKGFLQNQASWENNET